MKTNLLILAFAVISSAMMAQTVWDPAAFENSQGLWINPGNWTNGYPGSSAEAEKTQFKTDGAMDCIVDEDVTRDELVEVLPKLVLGDGGHGGDLYIKDGGVLNLSGTAGWSGIGWSAPSNLYVETGGEISFGSHMWIAFNAGAEGTEVHLEGGTINVDGMFGMDFKSNGAQCTFYLKDGLLNLAQWNPGNDDGTSMGPNAKIEYTGGVMQIAGDREESLNAFIDNGQITGTFEIAVDSFDLDNRITYLGKDAGQYVSVNSVSEVEKVSISPNPADDYLNVSLANDVIQSIEIIDLSGRVTDSFEYGNAKEATIQLQGIAKGIYIVKVKGKESTDFEKVIIK